MPPHRIAQRFKHSAACNSVIGIYRKKQKMGTFAAAVVIIFIIGEA